MVHAHNVGGSRGSDHGADRTCGICPARLRDSRSAVEDNTVGDSSVSDQVRTAPDKLRRSRRNLWLVVRRRAGSVPVCRDADNPVRQGRIPARCARVDSRSSHPLDRYRGHVEEDVTQRLEGSRDAVSRARDHIGVDIRRHSAGDQPRTARLLIPVHASRTGAAPARACARQTAAGRRASTTAGERIPRRWRPERSSPVPAAAVLAATRASQSSLR